MEGRIEVETLSPRQSGQYIVQHSNDVSIVDGKVKETAEVIAGKFKEEKFSIEGWKNHTLHPKVADEKAVDMIFAIDTLNFCFWPDVPGKKFVVQYKGKPYTGYWSLVAALKRAEDEGKPIFNADYMADIDEEEFRTILRSDSDVPIPLFSERLRVFRESGKVLLSKYQGTFNNCVREAQKDAVALLNIITRNFPAFCDEAIFNGKKVSFHKRAQILVADIWCCFEGKGLGEFKNIEEITMFADYRVPQSLEFFGILNYSATLKKILSERTILPSGHGYELEIRGSSIEAIERLTQEVRKLLLADNVSEEHLRTVNAITVDNFLWDYARAHRNEMNHLQFHLARTIYY